MCRLTVKINIGRDRQIRDAVSHAFADSSDNPRGGRSGDPITFLYRGLQEKQDGIDWNAYASTEHSSPKRVKYSTLAHVFIVCWYLKHDKYYTFYITIGFC